MDWLNEDSDEYLKNKEECEKYRNWKFEQCLKYDELIESGFFDTVKNEEVE